MKSIPEARKRCPFRAELPRIGHYMEYPQGYRHCYTMSAIYCIIHVNKRKHLRRSIHHFRFRKTERCHKIRCKLMKIRDVNFSKFTKRCLPGGWEAKRLSIYVIMYGKMQTMITSRSEFYVYHKIIGLRNCIKTSRVSLARI